MMSFTWCDVPFLWSGKAAIGELASATHSTRGINIHHMLEEAVDSGRVLVADWR
jgi:hypothetical protein